MFKMLKKVVLIIWNPIDFIITKFVELAVDLLADPLEKVVDSLPLLWRKVLITFLFALLFFSFGFVMSCEFGMAQAAYIWGSITSFLGVLAIPVPYVILEV